MKNRRGATIILAIGISTLLLVFAIGIGKVVQNSSKSIRDFKNKWQAGLVADSIKEQLMLESKDEGAGYNMDEGSCGDTISEVNKLVENIDKEIYKKKETSSNPTDYIQECAILEAQGKECPPPPEETECAPENYPCDTTNPQIYTPSGSINFKCSVQGTNDVEIDNTTVSSPITCDKTGDTNKCYTIPTANTGNAGIECNDKYPVTDVARLEQWVSMMFPKEIATDLSNAFFENDPLRHPCNWGKLKFGSDAGKRVIVPLYYNTVNADGTMAVHQLGSENSDQLYIRVRTPCKPIGIREVTVGGVTMQCKDITTPTEKEQAEECQYPNICSDTNRYALNTTSCPGGPGACKETQSDKTLLVWQISGECGVTGSTSGESQPCALIHNQELKTPSERADYNSEISESSLNDYNTSSGILSMGSSTVDDRHGTLTGKKMTVPFECGLETLQPNIKEFLNAAYEVQLAECPAYPFSSILNPTLQLAIIEPEIKDNDTPPNRVPYLEYQIVTNKPIANPLEIFSADVNFSGQNFKLVETIEQVKNIIDFAIQN